ncbi:MAG: hypothetical protein ACR2H5_16210 [Ktedonobacteraceae bacterium]
MAAPTSRRLPGFSIEMRQQPRSDMLPQMDVTVFVGFAQSGPLDTPCVVEDEAQFSGIFGDDVLLARDTEQGTPAYGYLASTVRAFFRNGGKRCWVIRVAGQPVAGRLGASQHLATYNYFPIPGLLRVTRSENGTGVELAPAFAHASSEGSWSDDFCLSAALSSLPISIDREKFLCMADDTLIMTITPNSASDVVVGDLLRLAYGPQGEYVQMVVVDQVSLLEADSTSYMRLQEVKRGRLKVTCTSVLWLSTANPTLSPPRVPVKGTSTMDASLYHSTYLVDDASVLPRMQMPTAFPIAFSSDPYELSDSQNLSLVLAPSTGEVLAPGMVLNVHDESTASHVWMTVQAVNEIHGTGPLASPPAIQSAEGRRVHVLGEGLWVLDAPPLQPESLQASLQKVEQLSFSLKVQSSDAPQQMDALTFDMRHPNCWNALPTDAQYNRPADMKTDLLHQDLWEAAFMFPLAGNYDERERYIPIGMPSTFPDYCLGVDCDPAQPRCSSLERDGLAVFGAHLFLDEHMVNASVTDLLSQADFFLPQDDLARSLKGIYAALSIAEATIISVPDAVQRGWTRATAVTSPPASLPLAHHEQRQQPETSARHPFHDCVSHVPPPGPNLAHSNPADPPDNTNQWQLIPVADYDEKNVLSVQRALLRMCAARGDLFAVLSLPAHYYVYEAEGYVELLQEPIAPVLAQTVHTLFADGANALSFPLTYAERNALTYGALYHPWLVFSEETQNLSSSTIPPEGAMCGILAQCSLTRGGAWLAPANQPLAGVIDLTPRIERLYYQRMLNAQVNLLRHDGPGTLILSQDTLSADDVDLRPINVRRLLILLRRLALTLGPNYVFEPNSEAFRRSVERGFEALLNDMFIRGAFAGDSPASSFQVVCDSTVNEPGSVEEGNFIVLLRVAPSLPMTFLTIRLVQSATDALVTES